MKRNEMYYQAYKLKDANFDGIFFIGATSTGIYCRPICTARMPKQKYCKFFTTAKIAQDNGFRPCRRCRPEITTGFSSVDIAQYLAKNAKKLIENGALDDHTLEQLAGCLGITSRHMRRIFITHYGTTPIKFAQFHRLSLCEKLLKNKSLTITQVALKSGFNSLRQFNALFKQKHHINPSQFRRNLNISNDI